MKAQLVLHGTVSCERYLTPECIAFELPLQQYLLGCCLQNFLFQICTVYKFSASRLFYHLLQVLPCLAHAG